MPEVTGGLGYCINPESSHFTLCLAEAVRKALEEPLNTALRKRIEQNFSASHREQAIFN